jgi:hypothetical protein
MTENKIHFEDEAWIGFALRLVPEDRAAQMQAHLDDGCAACGQTHKLWALVAEIAARESRFEPPQDLVDAAKAAFPLVQKLSLLPYIARPAQMTFDSSRGPVPAGLRGSGARGRHLLYETDDFVIDLRLEREEERRIALTGQIVPRGALAAHAPEVNVLVTGEKGRPLRHAIVNTLGEFQLELEEQNLLALYMQFSDSTIASIVLLPPTS